MFLVPFLFIIICSEAEVSLFRYVLYLCPGAVYIPPDVAELSAGDAVKVELDPDLFKIAQDDHGGWNDLMAEVYTQLVVYMRCKREAKGWIPCDCPVFFFLFKLTC